MCNMTHLSRTDYKHSVIAKTLNKEDTASTLKRTAGEISRQGIMNNLYKGR